MKIINLMNHIYQVTSNDGYKVLYEGSLEGCNNYIRLKVDVKISKFDDWYASPSIFKEFKMRTTTFSFNLN